MSPVQRRDDFHEPYELAKLAATAGVSPQKFCKEFEYLIPLSDPVQPVDGLFHSSFLGIL